MMMTRIKMMLMITAMMTGVPTHPPLAKYRMTPPMRVPPALHWHDQENGADGDDDDNDCGDDDQKKNNPLVRV